MLLWLPRSIAKHTLGLRVLLYIAVRSVSASVLLQLVHGDIQLLVFQLILSSLGAGTMQRYRWDSVIRFGVFLGE